MKYAIYGAGSLGLIFSAKLKTLGENFDIIDRNPKSVDAINTNGIVVTGKANIKAKCNAILESNVKEKYDIIFLFSKQINNIETISKVSKLLNENGVICTMQNGLPELDLEEVIGKDKAFGCAVGWGATRLDYGISELTSENEREHLSFSFGSFDNKRNEYYNEIVRILNLFGKVEEEENFIGARFSKLLINCAFSGISTVCGDTFGNVAKRKDSRRILQRIIKECIDVSRAANIKIEPIQGKDIVKLLDYKGKLKKKISFIIIPLAIKKHALLKASMLQDIEKGHPTEIDSINGIISKFGRQYGVPTPCNDLVVEIVKKEEQGLLKPSYENLKMFN